MPEETNPKSTKTKGKSRPSFSAPAHAAEARAWVDVPSSVDVIASPEPEVAAEILEAEPGAEHHAATPHHTEHEHPHAVAAETPLDSKSEAKAEGAAPVSSRRLRLLPKPRSAYRPQAHTHAEPQPPVRIPDPIPLHHTDARPASVSGAVVTGVGIALGLAVIGTYVAFELLAIPLRLASGLFGSRNSGTRTEL